MGWGNRIWIWNLRIELELSLRDAADVANAKVRSDTLTANIYYDSNNRSRFTPFVGIGASVSMIRLHIQNLDVKDSKYNFSGFGALGLNFRIIDSVSTSLSYRYFMLGSVGLTQEIDVGGPTLAVLDVSAKDTSSEFTFGIRYEF
jgi:opacity protein-like surface antigen